jgi:hypothetical protein
MMSIPIWMLNTGGKERNRSWSQQSLTPMVTFGGSVIPRLCLFIASALRVYRSSQLRCYGVRC